jgi:putative chitinase
MISAIQLHSICPSAKLSDIEKYLSPMHKAMAGFEISSRLRVCAFVSQILHESQYLSKMRENMNYRAERLLVVFPKYFTKESAALYGGNPQKIASRVYASRMGNGDESSMDGWKYRGGGAMHLTGKDMYERFSKFCSLDLVSKPEMISDPDLAMLSAAWVWNQKGLNSLADKGDIKGITRLINGGYNGLSERMELYNKALTLLK